MDAQSEQSGNAIGVLETSPYVKWAVVHRINFGGQWGDIAEYFVTCVHLDATYQNVKDIIENAGLFFGDGGVRWAGYSLYPEGNWIEGWRQEFNDLRKERSTYDDLLTMGRADRRITLRLSPGTHVALVHAAQERGISLNQIISDILDDWQERHGKVTNTNLANVANQAEVEVVTKAFHFNVSQLMNHPIYFVLLVAKQPMAARSFGGSPQRVPSPPKAIVEVRDGKAYFSTWERPVPSGRFSEGALRLAVEGAVERFLVNTLHHPCK